MSVIKNPEQVARMRFSAGVLSDCLDYLKEQCVPGITSAEIDEKAAEFIRNAKCKSAFKDYQPVEHIPPYPATICFSRNEVMVHGVPSEEEIIQEGDLITIDCGLSYDGWFADAARLFIVGEGSDEDKAIVKATEKTLQAGIDACVVGNKLGDVCHSIQNAAGLSPYFNVLQFCGHAIGTAMHEEPQVPNFGRPHRGPALQPGMVFCLEPMLKKTKTDLGVLPDGWSIRTLDCTRSTHIEHMVLITESDPEILTA